MHNWVRGWMDRLIDELGEWFCGWMDEPVDA